MGFNKEKRGWKTLPRKRAECVCLVSDRTIKMLEKTKMMNGCSMESKKLVLVAYLFDTHCGLLIDPSKNVSKSAGLERHIGVFTKEES